MAAVRVQYSNVRIALNALGVLTFAKYVLIVYAVLFAASLRP